MSIYVCVHICVYVYVHIYVCAYVYMLMHTHTHSCIHIDFQSVIPDLALSTSPRNLLDMLTSYLTPDLLNQKL